MLWLLAVLPVVLLAYGWGLARRLTIEVAQPLDGQRVRRQWWAAPMIGLLALVGFAALQEWWMLRALHERVTDFPYGKPISEQLARGLPHLLQAGLPLIAVISLIVVCAPRDRCAPQSAVGRRIVQTLGWLTLGFTMSKTLSVAQLLTCDRVRGIATPPGHVVCRGYSWVGLNTVVELPNLGDWATVAVVIVGSVFVVWWAGRWATYAMRLSLHGISGLIFLWAMSALLRVVELRLVFGAEYLPESTSTVLLVSMAAVSGLLAAWHLSSVLVPPLVALGDGIRTQQFVTSPRKLPG